MKKSVKKTIAKATKTVKAKASATTAKAVKATKAKAKRAAKATRKDRKLLAKHVKQAAHDVADTVRDAVKA
jgi:hypothetical protein